MRVAFLTVVAVLAVPSVSLAGPYWWFDGIPTAITVRVAPSKAFTTNPAGNAGAADNGLQLGVVVRCVRPWFSPVFDGCGMIQGAAAVNTGFIHVHGDFESGGSVLIEEYGFPYVSVAQSYQTPYLTWSLSATPYDFSSGAFGSAFASLGGGVFYQCWGTDTFGNPVGAVLYGIEPEYDWWRFDNGYVFVLVGLLLSFMLECGYGFVVGLMFSAVRSFMRSIASDD